MSLHLTIDRGIFDTRCTLERNGVLAGILWSVHDTPDPTGYIYHGRITEIKRELHAAFIQLDATTSGILRLTKSKKYQVGQRLLVQVTNFPQETHKLSHVTDRPTLTGRTVTLVPHGGGVQFSPSIDPKLRDTLKETLGDAISHNDGLLLHPICQHLDVKFVQQEIERLRRTWSQINHAKRNTISCLYQVAPLERALKEMTPWDLEKISSPTAETCNIIRHHVAKYHQELQDIVTPYFDRDGQNREELEEQISELTSPYATLQGGGKLTFEYTHGMTVVDVDGGSLRAKEANWKAALVLKQQLSLRRIGGLIVVDFITLPHMQNRQFRSYIQSLLKEDPLIERVSGPSPGGLVEIIRKRNGQPLQNSLEVPRDPETLSTQHQRLYVSAGKVFRQIIQGTPLNKVTLICSAQLADILSEKAALGSLSKHIGRPINLEINPNAAPHDFIIHTD